LILDDSNFEELLSLSQEYQADWLYERIETGLLDCLYFHDTGDIIKGWLLSDQYNLKRLKRRLQCINSKEVNLEDLVIESDFYRLQTTTKYVLVRKVLANNLGDDSESFLRFLDQFFNIENTWVK